MMAKKTNNTNLFPEIESEWRKEWKDMPEFEQDDLSSARKIVVHFRNENDVKEFSKLIGQKITAKQLSLWFPVMEYRRYSNKRYIDES